MSIFDRRFIAVKDSFSDWKEAVTYSGNLLLKERKIEKSYIDAMINNIEEIGPYILIAPKVAMPHSRPEHGVNEKGISVVVLKEPTYLGGNIEKEVKLIICLAATDADSHLELLKTVSTWLADDTTRNKIMNAETEEALDEILSKFYL